MSQKHSDSEEFIPASQIPRTANYRGGPTHPGAVAGGPRIGVPPAHIPEDDLTEFSIALTASTPEPLGPLSGFGQHLVHGSLGRPGEVTETDIYGRQVTAGGQTYYDPPIEVAQIDREETSGRGIGTPGRGVPVDNDYGYEDEVGVRQAQQGDRRMLMKEQLAYYCSMALECVKKAQFAEDRGNMPAARLFDAKASEYEGLAQKTEQQLVLYEDYQTRVR